MKRHWKTKVIEAAKGFAKFGGTAIALYWVLSQTDLDSLYRKLLNSDPAYLLLALLVFLVSQLFASSRIHLFFKAISLNLSAAYNFKLYLLGMFYNMFLPGGVAGDGYKIFLLKKYFGVATKKLVVAKLLDKLSGFLSLAFLALSLLLFSRMLEVPSLLILLIILFGIGSYYLMYKKFLPVFAPYFIKTHIRALGLQGSQIICAMFILKSLGYPGPYIPYLVIFTISSR